MPALLAALSASAPLAARRNSVVEVVENAGKAVVNISTETLVRRRYPGFFPFPDELFEREFERFFGPTRAEVKTSIGSGVVFDPRGYVVTNEHAVRKAGRIHVRTSSGRSMLAFPVGLDPEHDLAVLRLRPGAPFHCALFDPSDVLYVGETVIAIGNPFGYENTVTTGVVSAKDRTIPTSRRSELADLIQTDAAINPGNSGGPLLSIEGKVIGINTAIRAEAEGIGFAVPVKWARKLARQCVPREGDIPELGLGLARGEGAVLVEEVDPISPAEEAGLQRGDVIAAIGGSRVGSPEEFVRAARRLARMKVRVRVSRGGQKRDAVIDLGALVEGNPVLWRGMLLRPIGPMEVAAFDLALSRGVVIARGDEGSRAWRSGLKAGDVLIQLGRYRVETVAGLAGKVRSIPESGEVFVRVERKGELYYGALR